MMRKLAAHEATNDEVAFDEQEFPTRRSAVNLVDFAREAEALLANGLEVESAQMLRATITPPAAFGDRLSLESELRLAASPEELEWFPLSDEASAILRALARPALVRDALQRAGLAHDEGLEHVRTLLELGLVALS